MVEAVETGLVDDMWGGGGPVVVGGVQVGTEFSGGSAD